MKAIWGEKSKSTEVEEEEEEERNDNVSVQKDVVFKADEVVQVDENHAIILPTSSKALRLVHTFVLYQFTVTIQLRWGLS